MPSGIQYVTLFIFYGSSVSDTLLTTVKPLYVVPSPGTNSLYVTAWSERVLDDDISPEPTSVKATHLHPFQ